MLDLFIFLNIDLYFFSFIHIVCIIQKDSKLYIITPKVQKMHNFKFPTKYHFKNNEHMAQH